jgi:large subunit ribosomal protein L10
MDNPRVEKVAVVDEVRERLSGSTASVVTEYRGLTVTELAVLRHALASVGGDYKVFKNTLVRRAVAETDHAGLEPLLVGPTAIAFVHGDVSAVAKALRDFARTSPALIVKGGVLDGNVLSPGDLTALADLPSKDVLLARVAGAIAAPLQTLAGLLEALPRSFAYGLSALLEQRQANEPAPAPAAEAPAAEATPDAVPAQDDAGPAAEEPATSESAETDTAADASAPEGSEAPADAAERASAEE